MIMNTCFLPSVCDSCIPMCYHSDAHLISPSRYSKQLSKQAASVHAAGSTQSAEEMVQAMRDQPRKPLTDWCAVSSVYFDDAELQAYLSRLQRDDEASVIRVRWYGSRSTSSAQELFVERKVHREPWTGERSHKVAPKTDNVAAALLAVLVH